MNLFRNSQIGRLWNKVQFVFLALALVLPLFSRLGGHSQSATGPSLPDAQDNLPNSVGRSPASDIPKNLSSGVISLPEVNLYPKITLISSSRQIRFERVSKIESRSPASLSKDRDSSFKLLRIRQRLENGEDEEIPLILNGVGKRQPIGSVFIELGHHESIFWADYMDRQGKIWSQEIRLKRAGSARAP